MFEAADFQNRASRLQSEIADSKQASSELEQKLIDLQQGWNEYHSEAVSDLKHQIDEIDMAAMLRLLEQQAADL